MKSYLERVAKRADPSLLSSLSRATSKEDASSFAASAPRLSPFCNALLGLVLFAVCFLAANPIFAGTILLNGTFRDTKTNYTIQFQQTSEDFLQARYWVDPSANRWETRVYNGKPINNEEGSVIHRKSQSGPLTYTTVRQFKHGCSFQEEIRPLSSDLVEVKIRTFGEHCFGSTARYSLKRLR